jgi:PIN domain nuclease of toxin-antitoxin system
MNKVILDSSALLAFINQEQGSEIVEKYLPNALMSSINIAEVIAVLSMIDMPEDIITGIIDDLNVEVINFDQEQALQTGFLRKTTKNAGLSLGDCACISVSSIKNLIIITANKIWTELGLKNDIVLIR